MSTIAPYIRFFGDARSAMEHYRGLFGGKLDFVTYSQIDGIDSSNSERIMHSILLTDFGMTIMGADVLAPAEYQFSPSVAISLNGHDEDQLRRCWTGLAEGGSVSVPLEKQSWGEVFGKCIDRFGIEWMVSIH